MIGNDWDVYLEKEFKKDYFIKLNNFLMTERKEKTVYPPKKHVFDAFKVCPLQNTKVVIIGQDPYHGEGQAHGLSFSVKDRSLKIPPSLKNIYKELESDLGIEPAVHADLTSWAKQGVLLLNNVLTVRASEPGSHRKKGWEIFTDKVIDVLNSEKQNLVFILWGNDAIKKAASINQIKHKIFSSAHPSPFSVKNFTGNKHFSKTNKFLESHKFDPIDWVVR